MKSKALMAQFEVLHQLPHRLRVKLPALLKNQELAEDLEALLRGVAGVTDARGNSYCASLSISYKAEIFDPILWLEKLDLSTVPRHQLAEHDISLNAHTFGHGNQWSVARLPHSLGLVRRRTFQFERLVPPRYQFALGAAALAATALELPAVITASILAASVSPIINRAVQTALLEKRVGADALDGATCAILIKSGNFLPAAVMTSLIGLGELMRHLITEECDTLINHQLALSERSAWLIKGHQRLRVPLDELKAGDRVAIYPGEMIPCHGRIVSGRATVVSASPNKDYAPRCVTVDEPLEPDLLLVGGKVYLQVENIEQVEIFSSHEKHMRERHHRRWLQQTRLHRQALKKGYKAVLPLVSMAGLTFAVTGNIERALSIVCFDFITGAKIAIPTAVLASMFACGKKGVVVKNAGSLETLAEIDTVIFARSGVLTAVDPRIIDIKVAPGFTLEQVTVYAAAVQRRYDNMAAYAIYNFAPAHNTPIPERKDSNHISGLGVEGTVEGHSVLVGRTRLMRERGIDLSPMSEYLDQCLKRGDARACVAIDGVLAAVVAFNDPLRTDVKEVVCELGTLGVSEIAMVTGVSENAAKMIAEKAGIKKYYAKTMPEEQAEIIREYKRQGRRVAVVGHDVDDVLALEHADLAITLGNSADVARLRADVVLTSENLTGLVEGIKIARQGMQNARNNLAIVTAPNYLGLGLTAVGAESFLMATALNNGSVIVATANGLQSTFGEGEEDDESDCNHIGTGYDLPDANEQEWKQAKPENHSLL